MVREARRRVAAELAGRGVPREVVEDARVVVSELLGNALRHARPGRSGEIELRLTVDEDRIRLAVVDGGSATLPTLRTPPELSTTGRGLSIVRTLTCEWGVREAETGNTVYGVLRAER